MKRTIGVVIDLNDLARRTDVELAALWGVAQLDPAPLGDWGAGETVRLLTAEIVGRWLRGAGLPVANHQVQSYHWGQLTRFARYVPPAGVRPDDARWHEGTWEPRLAASAGTVVQEVVDAAVSFREALLESPEDVRWRREELLKAVGKLPGVAAPVDGSAVQA